MKKILIPLILCAATPSFGVQIKEASCFDLERVIEDITPQYLAIADGYNHSGKKGDQIDVGEIVAESQRVNKECMKNNDSKIAGIEDDMKSVAVVHSTETLNVASATCKDFNSLGSDGQPVAAFWVAGHEKMGPIKKGEFDQKLLENPITGLVQQCKDNPSASFYATAKNWMRDNF